MVNIATTAGLGFSADDSAFVLPLDHFYGLGKCRTVALGDHQIATVVAVGDSDFLDLSKQVPEVEFACQRLRSGAYGKSEQQIYQQRFNHDVPEFGSKGDPYAQSSKQVTPIATQPVTVTHVPLVSSQVYGAGRTSIRIRNRLPGSVGILVAYF